jgi:hypothetical protein
VLIYRLQSVEPWRTRIANALAQTGEPRLTVSELSRMECRVKPLREGDTSALARFDRFFTSPMITIVPLGRAVFDLAIETILLCTVGGSHQPILTAIQELKPAFVLFFATGRDQATGKPGSIETITGNGHPIQVRSDSGDVEHLPNIQAQAALVQTCFRRRPPPRRPAAASTLYAICLWIAYNRGRCNPARPCLQRAGQSAWRALEQLEMGFLPVPALLLSQRDLVLINAPDPARFAWHKLPVSEERPLAMAAKRAKDRLQAAQLLAVLQEEAPTQLATARAQLKARGRGWSQRLERALAQCEACAAALAGDHPHP